MYFNPVNVKIDVLVLRTPVYWRLPVDGDLSLKHVGGGGWYLWITGHFVRMCWCIKMTA
jgi:hypothetical protein